MAYALLAAAGTIDQQVMQALETKSTTQSALIDAVAANLEDEDEVAA